MFTKTLHCYQILSEKQFPFFLFLRRKGYTVYCETINLNKQHKNRANDNI